MVVGGRIQYGGGRERAVYNASLQVRTAAGAGCWAVTRDGPKTSHCSVMSYIHSTPPL